MKLNKVVFAITIMCFSLCATGCGEALYTMTDEEETIVALYAAKMVTKFNKNQTTGICNARVRDGELDEAYGITTDETEEEDTSVETAETTEMNEDGTTPDVSADTSEIVDSSYSLTDAIGIEGMEFSCYSVDSTDEYKVNESFVLTASSGKSYFVVYLYGTNTTDADIDFSNLDTATYKLSVNGSDLASTQNTFFDYDLSLYDGTVAAGDTVSFILVFQVASSSISEENSLNLQVTRNGESRGTTLNINQL